MIAVSIKNRAIHVRHTRVPRRPEGFALIRLLAGGICNTDLELQRGYYDFSGTPGHEFAGEVVQADDIRWLGRRVVGEINLACRKCGWCRRGLGRHCPTRTVLGIVKHPGAFREYLTLPEANLHEVPAVVTNEQAVFVEPLAAACEILDQVAIPPSAEVAVLGDGKLGLLIAQVLKASGFNVHQFGRHPDKLRISERAGVVTRLAGKRMHKSLYELVIDATGSTEGLRQAVQMTRPRGTVVMKSTLHRPVPFHAAPVIVNEITLVGSRCGRFEPALDLLKSGRIDVDAMVSDRFRLRDAAKASKSAAGKGVLKVLLEP